MFKSVLGLGLRVFGRGVQGLGLRGYGNSRLLGLRV